MTTAIASTAVTGRHLLSGFYGYASADEGFQSSGDSLTLNVWSGWWSTASFRGTSHTNTTLWCRACRNGSTLGFLSITRSLSSPLRWNL